MQKPKKAASGSEFLGETAKGQQILGNPAAACKLRGVNWARTASVSRRIGAARGSLSSMQGEGVRQDRCTIATLSSAHWLGTRLALRWQSRSEAVTFLFQVDVLVVSSNEAL
jgi:hypothetical protein